MFRRDGPHSSCGPRFLDAETAEVLVLPVRIQYAVDGMRNNSIYLLRDLESSGVWRGQLDVGRALEQRDI